MADFRQTTARSASPKKLKGLTYEKTDEVLAQLREMYPEQYVNRYAISKHRNEYAPMISVLGNNLKLFEKRVREEHLEFDFSQYIPPTSERILSPYVSGGKQKYYTIFGEVNTDILFPTRNGLVFIDWKATFPAEGFDEAFRLNFRENGSTGTITLSKMESRLQRAKVRAEINKIERNRSVEYSVKSTDALRIVAFLDEIKDKNVQLWHDPSNNMLTITAINDGKSISVNTETFRHGKGGETNSTGMYSTDELQDAFLSYASTEFSSDAMISFGGDRLFAMRYDIIEPTPGYVQHPIRELAAMKAADQEKAREAKAVGHVLVLSQAAESNGRAEKISLGIAANAKSKKVKR